MNNKIFPFILINLTLLFVTTVANASSNPAPPPTVQSGKTTGLSTEAIKQFQVLALDENNHPLDKITEVTKFKIEFPLIQGSVWGITTTRAIASGNITLGKTMDLPMSQIANAMAPLAKRPSKLIIKNGFSVIPANARIARLGTTISEPLSSQYLAVGFQDSLTFEYMTLIYVDRPCTLIGNVSHLGKNISINANIPSKGIHWLRLRSMDDQNDTFLYDDGTADMLLTMRELQVGQ